MSAVPDTMVVQTDTTMRPTTNNDAAITVTGQDYKKDDILPVPASGRPKAHLYRMNYWLSGGFSLIATAANIYAIPNLILAKKDLTPAEVNSVNRDAVPAFDRIALRQDPTQIDQYDKATDYMLQGIIVSTAILGFDKKIRRDALRLFVMYAETQSVTYSIYNFSPFGPSFQNKLRPVVYYPEIAEDRREEGNNRNSLYSGHTANAAASTFFVAKVFNDYHPEFSTAKKLMFYGLASIPPLALGYYRVKALKHFPSDVGVGFIIGAVCGIAVPEMHRYKKQAIRWGVTATPVGPGLCMVWRPK